MSDEDDKKIIEQAQKRFKRCQDFEGVFRSLYLDDTRFANADSDNGWQWPQSIRNNRNTSQQPCLTINKTRQHNLQITNDAKENKPAITIHPTGGEATYETAEVMEGIVRHIEYISNAQVAYDTANESQVEGGIGYWRVVTDYIDDKNFDQEIFIRRIRDAMSVYLDPDITESDGSDARYGFVFTDLPKDKFKEQYPDFQDAANLPLLPNNDWLTPDHIRIAEYYYIEQEKDKLVALPMPDGSTTMELLSKLPPQIQDMVKKDKSIKKREVKIPALKWCKLAGHEIIDRRDQVGKYVPIVRVVGEERIIQGELDRKGHTRNLKDAQRMYNYWTSSAVEFVALQGKQPYLAPVAAINGFETYWATANTANHSYLPYNHMDGDGQQIPTPTRQQPPTMAQAYIQGMQVASEEMKMVSGQYDNSLGKAENETSGVAIMQRQRQGDKATYQFIDHLAIAIRFTGKILIDLIPKIYDTPRIIRILAEDGTEDQVQIDPNMPQPMVSSQQQDEKIQRIFNPGMGTYDVTADVGPSYQTRRQEAFAAMSQMMSQNSNLMGVAGDLLFKAADFPMADDIAERLARTIPDNIKGDAPDPQIEELQGALQQAQMMAKGLVDQMASEAEQKDIDVYKAETDRMKALEKGLDPQQIAMLTAQIVIQAMQTPFPPNESGNPEQPLGQMNANQGAFPEQQPTMGQPL